MRKSIKVICSFVLTIFCLTFLSACGGNSGGGSVGGFGGAKTFGEASKGLTPPTDTDMKTYKFLCSLPEAKQNRLFDMFQLMKEKGQLGDYKSVVEYGIGGAGNDNRSIPVGKDNEQVTTARDKGTVNAFTILRFKFYEIKLNSDYGLPKNEADIKVQEIKPKTLEKYIPLKKGEQPPDVFYYCIKRDFQSEAYYVVADKLYLAVPYYGKLNEKNIQDVTVFVIEPTEFNKLKTDKLDKSYSTSVFLKTLFEDFSMLTLILNGPFCAIKENQGIRDEYDKWLYDVWVKESRKNSEQSPLASQQANVSVGTKTSDNSAKPSADYKPINMNLIQGVYHSSALKDGGNTYHGYLTMDGDIKTCWAEGAPGQGIGENIRVDFKDNCKISGLNIWTGYQKSEDLFYKNSRPIAIRVLGSDGSNEIYKIEDKMGKQRVDFKQPIYGDSLRIVIHKIAPGSKFDDTCIAEIDFF